MRCRFLALRGQPLTGAALVRRTERLLAERQRFYERAHVAVDTAEAAPEETAAAIVEAETNASARC